MNNAAGKYFTKAQWVYENLKQRILEGTLRPGERLVTTRIAREFGVSPIPVREAISRLQAEGLISSTPHTAVEVRNLELKDLVDIYEIRICLEGLATRLAVLQKDPSLVGDLEDIMTGLSAAAAAGRRDEFDELNRRFHLRVYASCDNEHLNDLITSFRENMDRFAGYFLTTSRELNDSLAEHRAILEAIRAGDAMQAEQLMIEHKRRSFEALLKVLAERNGTSGTSKEGVSHEGVH